MGMLLAPKKGTDLRTDVLGYLEDLNKRACEILDQGKEKLSLLARSSVNGK